MAVLVALAACGGSGGGASGVPVTDCSAVTVAGIEGAAELGVVAAAEAEMVADAERLADGVDWVTTCDYDGAVLPGLVSIEINGFGDAADARRAFDGFATRSIRPVNAVGDRTVVTDREPFARIVTLSGARLVLTTVTAEPALPLPGDDAIDALAALVADAFG